MNRQHLGYNATIDLIGIGILCDMIKSDKIGKIDPHLNRFRVVDLPSLPHSFASSSGNLACNVSHMCLGGIHCINS